MKYCDNCKKIFSDDKSFCSFCGNKLEELPQMDIFGDEIKPRKESEHKRVYSDSYQKFEYGHRGTRNAGEILALISLGLCFVPLFGTGVTLTSLILNSKTKEFDRNSKKYFILSLILLIFSVVWLGLLIYLGIFPQI